MKKKYLLLPILLTTLPLSSFAIFCPTNFSQISEGMSPEEVKAMCGAPNAIETKEDEANVPQEWSYFITQQVVPTSNTSETTGTLKVTVMFDATGKAINITANGIGVGATTACGVGFQLGDSRDQVKAACGKPATIAKDASDPTQLGGAQPPVKTVIFTYSSGPTPATLTFVNGKLTLGK